MNRPDHVAIDVAASFLKRRGGITAQVLSPVFATVATLQTGNLTPWTVALLGISAVLLFYGLWDESQAFRDAKEAEVRLAKAEDCAAAYRGVSRLYRSGLTELMRDLGLWNSASRVTLYMHVNADGGAGGVVQKRGARLRQPLARAVGSCEVWG